MGSVPTWLAAAGAHPALLLKARASLLTTPSLNRLNPLNNLLNKRQLREEATWDDNSSRGAQKSTLFPFRPQVPLASQTDGSRANICPLYDNVRPTSDSMPHSFGTAHPLRLRHTPARARDAHRRVCSRIRCWSKPLRARRRCRGRSGCWGPRARRSSRCRRSAAEPRSPGSSPPHR